MNASSRVVFRYRKDVVGETIAFTLDRNAGLCFLYKNTISIMEISYDNLIWYTVTQIICHDLLRASCQR